MRFRMHTELGNAKKTVSYFLVSPSKMVRSNNNTLPYYFLFCYKKNFG